MKPKTKHGISSAILSFLAEIGEMIPEPFETPYAYIRRAGHISPKRYYDTVLQLQRRGALEITEQNHKRFLKITHRGALDTLLAKFKIKNKTKWDKKWRLLIFDIPKAANKHRDHLRFLLKKSGFKKLQASVFISPYPLNREAIDYLKHIRLIDYVRILRVDEIDDDTKLRQQFKV